MQASRSRLLTLALLVGVASGCSQPIEPSPTPSETPASPQPAGNPVTAWRVSAGADVWLPSPRNTLVLSGFVVASPSAITSYAWRKVSGPGAYTIENPDSLRTTVGNLEQGSYEFEVTVTAADGWTAKDAVRIEVYDPRGPGANEFTFRNVPWLCPFGCAANVENYPFPAGTPLKVWVKKDGDAEWTEVKPQAQWIASDQFVYGFQPNWLSVYADDEMGLIDIRVIF